MVSISERDIVHILVCQSSTGKLVRFRYEILADCSREKISSGVLPCML